MASDTFVVPEPTLRTGCAQFVRLGMLLRPYWRPTLRALGLGIIISVFSMGVPYTSKVLIDTAYPARDVTLMEVVVVGLGVMSVASALLGTLQSYYNQTVGSRLSTAVSLLFFNHLQFLPVQFYETHRTGEVMSRFQDMRQATTLVSSTLQTLLTSGIYIILVPPFLALLNWRLAVLSIAVTPVTAAVTTMASRAVRRHYRQNAELSAELGAYQFEVLSHIRTLKTMGVESMVYERVHNEAVQALQSGLRAGRLSALVSFANNVVRALGTAVFTYYGWTLILRDQMSLGDFIAFSAYLGYLTGPVNNLAGLFGAFQQGTVSLARVFEYLDEPVEQDASLAYVPLSHISARVRGSLEFRGVSFAYTGTDAVLRDVCVTAQPGTITAIIGASGAGKSSLLRLVPRLAEPTRGEILLDGAPLKNIQLTDLRRQIAAVWQEFALMRGTVWDNLTLGVTDVSRDVADEVLDICQLGPFIEELPLGLDTPVAEWGSTLSGGQRQRLALARSLVRRAPILLLDEPTANVDLATEAAILERLRSWTSESTVLFVTHRTTSTLSADQVWILEDGGIAACDTPSRLVASSRQYRQLLEVGRTPSISAPILGARQGGVFAEPFGVTA